MPKMKVPGLNKSAGATFPVWDEGWYLMQAVVARDKVSRNGNPQVQLTLVIQDVAEDVGEQSNGRDPIGRKYTEFFTFSGYDFQVDQFKEVCNAFGVSVTTADNIDLDDFIDAEGWVRLSIDANEDTGEKSNRIRGARPVEAS